MYIKSNVYFTHAIELNTLHLCLYELYPARKSIYYVIKFASYDDYPKQIIIIRTKQNTRHTHIYKIVYMLYV